MVPITCPDSEEKVEYTQAEVNKQYKLNQSLECYVQKDYPERPLLVKAKLLPHVSLAILLFTVPIITIILTLCACIVSKNVKLQKKEKKLNVALEKSSEKVNLSTSQQYESEDECSSAAMWSAAQFIFYY